MQILAFINIVKSVTFHVINIKWVEAHGIKWIIAQWVSGESRHNGLNIVRLFQTIFLVTLKLETRFEHIIDCLEIETQSINPNIKQSSKAVVIKVTLLHHDLTTSSLITTLLFERFSSISKSKCDILKVFFFSIIIVPLYPTHHHTCNGILRDFLRLSLTFWLWILEKFLFLVKLTETNCFMIDNRLQILVSRLTFFWNHQRIHTSYR